MKLKTVKKINPQCYAFTTPGVTYHNGWVKIGYTERDVETRINEETHTAHIAHKTEWHMAALYITEPFGAFTDKDFFVYLSKLGIRREKGTEWFQIDPQDARSHYIEFMSNHGDIGGDYIIPYTLRDEQKDAVNHAMSYFKTHPKGEFLLNCKPRFGKCLTVYDLCKQMDYKNVLIVTNRPAILNSWMSDFNQFLGRESGYAFVSNDTMSYNKYIYNKARYKGMIRFLSLQDLKGAISFGGGYDKLEEVADIYWDLLVVDEAHEGVDTYKTDTAFDQIKRNATIHLSGTPFKELASNKFPENAIFNWTYADEQKAKAEWDDARGENPYRRLPQLNMFTYKMSDLVLDKAKKGIELAEDDVEEYAFDLNEFFATNKKKQFIHEDDVDKFLDSLTMLPRFPFSTEELRGELRHTFWLLNRVDSAKALAEKLDKHPVFGNYAVILAAGDGKKDESDFDENMKSYDKVMEAIKCVDEGKKYEGKVRCGTITLSVGQLTTGVTVKPWTGVMMLSNLKSESLYMQAAFRVQNPYTYTHNGEAYAKQNAYVFDFDPARTLMIFERFANGLYRETSGDKGDSSVRKRHVRELLNYFPVYGEQDGEMVPLDAEKVMSIPRHIYAKEVVERGFMSNFLFDNISNVFGAPKEIIEIINKFEHLKEPKKLEPVGIDENTKKELSLNDKGEVEIPDEKIIGINGQVFGKSLYKNLEDSLEESKEKVQKNPNPKKNELDALMKAFADPYTKAVMKKTDENYDLKPRTRHKLESDVNIEAKKTVAREYGRYQIDQKKHEKEHQEKLKEAQDKGASMHDITKLDKEFKKETEKRHEKLLDDISKSLTDREHVSETTEKITRTAETEKLESKADDIKAGVRDHLRGFSRTIPSFLMAYGDRYTTLSNFEAGIPEDVFKEVTSITLDQFKMLRDGGDYTSEEGELKHFDGHLFDEAVFNESVQEFLNAKERLADYFKSEEQDIFDYIPSQKTNQIFTPKKVVKEMTDLLEEENPGCFDDPNNTFIDLYMKSGLYIAEVVRRLYQSEGLIKAFPDEKERLEHIFEKQVYGLAPTEIIYRITLSFILGFNDAILIKKHNLRRCDSLKYAQSDDPNALQKKLDELFDD